MLRDELEEVSEEFEELKKSNSALAVKFQHTSEEF
jgi:hypothetical protein